MRGEKSFFQNNNNMKKKKYGRDFRIEIKKSSFFF